MKFHCSAVGLGICEITARIKKYKSIIKKKKKNHYEILLLEKAYVKCYRDLNF